MSSQHFLSLIQKYLPQREANQHHTLARFLELLQKWNQTFNLTSIHHPEDMVIHHLLDSFSIEPYLQGQRFIDVGTGAGLPGIPLAITHPEQHFVLLECVGKKVRFMTQAALTLHLKNVEIVQARVEDYHPVRCFDRIITRAFASLSKMLDKTKHLSCSHTLFLAMKGQYPTEELKKIKPPFTIETVETLSVPHLKAARHLVLIKCDRNTEDNHEEIYSRDQ